MTTTTTSDTQAPGAPALTFGVEIECLTPWLYEDDEDPHGDVEGLPPPFRVSREAVESSAFFSANLFAENLIYREIKATLVGLGLSSTLVEKKDLSKGDSSKNSDEGENGGLENYAEWRVEDDISVRQVESHGYETSIRQYARTVQWIGVEIQSPVEVASGGSTGAGAFDAIRYAVNVLKSKYRLRINNSCSVHVHVGLGEERMPLDKVRRLGALCYAADLLLFTLHDPLRRASSHCRPIREYSNLSRLLGMTPRHAENATTLSNCVRYLGADVRYGEAPITWRERNQDEATVKAFERTRRPGHFEPFVPSVEGDEEEPLAKKLDDLSVLDNKLPSPKPGPARNISAPRQPVRARALMRIAFPKLTDSELRALRGRTGSLSQRPGLGMRGVKPVPPRGQLPVMEATRRIFEAESSCEVSQMLSVGGQRRGSISFNNYECRSIAQEPSDGDKPTVEFRLASASLDGEWIATWARICAGVVRFALYASPTEYLDVIKRMDGAEYDVIDLLDDLGLIAEAEVAERRLQQNREEWGLKFVDSK